MKRAGIEFEDIEVFFLVGGIGNYINIDLAIDLVLCLRNWRTGSFQSGTA